MTVRRDLGKPIDVKSGAEAAVATVGLMQAKKPPLALCPSCSTPLIATILFPKAEFLCLGCGAKVGFLSPRRGDPDDEQLQARYAELKGEWDEHVGNRAIAPRSWKDSCDRCRVGSGEYHAAHATEEELAASEAAFAWIEKRVGR